MPRPVRYRPCDIICYPSTHTPYWWVSHHATSAPVSFQPRRELSPYFPVVKSTYSAELVAFCGYCFDFLTAKNFTSDLILILRKSLCFQVLFQEKQFFPTPKMLVILNFLLHSSCTQTLNKDTDKPTVFLKKVSNEKQDMVCFF